MRNKTISKFDVILYLRTPYGNIHICRILDIIKTIIIHKNYSINSYAKNILVIRNVFWINMYESNDGVLVFMFC